MNQPTPAMLIAAAIVRENPHIADDTKLLGAILNGLKSAILDEREACLDEANKLTEARSTNREEYSDQQAAVLFVKDAVASNIADAITKRPAP